MHERIVKSQLRRQLRLTEARVDRLRQGTLRRALGIWRLDAKLDSEFLRRLVPTRLPRLCRADAPPRLDERTWHKGRDRNEQGECTTRNHMISFAYKCPEESTSHYAA